MRTTTCMSTLLVIIAVLCANVRSKTFGELHGVYRNSTIRKIRTSVSVTSETKATTLHTAKDIKPAKDDITQVECISGKSDTKQLKNEARHARTTNTHRPNYHYRKVLVNKTKLNHPKPNNTTAGLVEEYSTQLIKTPQPKRKSNYLRTLLAPRPRHIQGPMMTITEEQEEVKEENSVPEVFSCPKTEDKRTWTSHPDPNSCRHYYICTGASPPSRHGCTEAFNKRTGTCDSNENVKYCKDNQDIFDENKNDDRKKEKKDESSFMEFIQFLTKQGVFNKKMFMYLMKNKNNFL